MSDYEPKCKKTLPIIFDDRMPASNLTPKLVGRVNDNTEDLKNLYEETETMQGDIDSLQDDVDGKLDVPETAGTSGQVLTSDGEGGAVWTSVGSGEIVVDPTLTVEGAAADAKKTGDEITHLKQDNDELENQIAQTGNAVFNFEAVSVYTTASGWRLNESDGCCSQNSGYKLVKYHVTSGDYMRIASDDRFQFQSAESVPAREPSNRMGITYEGSIALVKVPENATFLIVSETVEGTPSVYKGVEISERLDTLKSNINQLRDDVVDVTGIHGKSVFTVSANTTHSSTLDKVTCDIKNGQTFYVAISADKSTNVVGGVYLYTSSGSVSLGTVTFNGSRYKFTASADAVAIGVYIGSLNYEQTYTLIVEQDENIYQYLDAVKSEQTVLRENVFKNSNRNFLFFTDVHASSENVSRIVEYANKNSTSLAAVINGGDIVSQYLNDGIAWYNAIIADCDVDVLVAVGNHDVWGNALYDKLPATTVYNNYIAPVASSVSNLVQPANAATEGKCYYYKDYGAIRVIVLNAMTGADSVVYWDSAQKTWFESALADAKTNGKHVLCVNHVPFAQADRIVNTDSSWTTYNPVFDSMVLETEAVTAVQNFIDGGGIFVGWLAGHTHRDILMSNSDGQFMFCCSTAHFANSYFHADSYGSPANTDPTFDCFDLVGIDTTNKILKMSRVGLDTDAGMKKRTALAYNYGTGEFVTDR